MKIVLLAADTSGHRAEFINLFSDLYTEMGYEIEVSGPRLSHVFNKGPIFSLMLEEHAVKYFLLASIRAVMGRRSAALVFRNDEFVHGSSVRMVAKRCILSLLRKTKSASQFTIVPFDRKDRLSSIASGWVFDPQLWDWCDHEPSIDQSTLSLLREEAGERKIVVSLGMQNYNKGFNFFVSQWLSSEEVRDKNLFVAAGSHVGCDIELKRQFVEAGGMVIDRFIKPEELRAFYEAADLVWSCYAPNYDQASGVFGRAYQIGVPAAVRAGSNIEKVASYLGCEVVAVVWNDTASGCKALKSIPEKTGRRDCKKLRDLSLSRISKALSDT